MQDEHVVQCILIAVLNLRVSRDLCPYPSCLQSTSSDEENDRHVNSCQQHWTTLCQSSSIWCVYWFHLTMEYSSACCIFNGGYFAWGVPPLSQNSPRLTICWRSICSKISKEPLLYFSAGPCPAILPCWKPSYFILAPRDVIIHLIIAVPRCVRWHRFLSLNARTGYLKWLWSSPTFYILLPSCLRLLIGDKTTTDAIMLPFILTTHNNSLRDVDLFQVIHKAFRKNAMAPVLPRCPCCLPAIQPSTICIHKTARSIWELAYGWKRNGIQRSQSISLKMVFPRRLWIQSVNSFCISPALQCYSIELVLLFPCLTDFEVWCGFFATWRAGDATDWHTVDTFENNSTKKSAI